MATIIDSRDFNRYEVVKVSPLLTEPLNVVLDSGRAEKSTSVDAFGRLRVSNPTTLFDSSHRYHDNGYWATATATGGTSTFNANQGLVDLAVTSTSGSSVYRETYRVFPYQPGKSLLVLTTFVFNAAKTNLRQRVGYFSSTNGFFLELNGTTLSFVRRSSVTGSVVETKIAQADWNLDKLDGTGVSGLTLDITKAQILWADIEWLGVGSIRMGFVIDGKFIACHVFDHANVATTTYMTTATLPVRYEIENTGTTASASTLKQICSSVISEGGYQVSGDQVSIETPIASPISLTTSGTTYPVLSIRLKSSPNCLDSVAILTGISLLGISSNTYYNWKIISGGATSGGTWVSAGAGSNVEYKINGSSIVGGTQVATGFTASTNQSVTGVDLFTNSVFQYQLERDSFTSTPRELTLAVAASTNSASVYAAIDFQEITH